MQERDKNTVFLCLFTVTFFLLALVFLLCSLTSQVTDLRNQVKELKEEIEAARTFELPVGSSNPKQAKERLDAWRKRIADEQDH
jgi:hypothetical protein